MVVCGLKSPVLVSVEEPKERELRRKLGCRSGQSYWKFLNRT